MPRVSMGVFIHDKPCGKWSQLTRVYLTDYIKGEMGSDNYVVMIAIDVQKAFDCVNHNIFCK